MNESRRRFLATVIPGMFGLTIVPKALDYLLGPSSAYGKDKPREKPLIVNPEDRTTFFSLLQTHDSTRTKLESLTEEVGGLKEQVTSLEEELRGVSLENLEQEQQVAEKTSVKVYVSLRPRARDRRLTEGRIFVGQPQERGFELEEARHVDRVECTFDGERFPLVKIPTWFIATVDGVQADYEVWYMPASYDSGEFCVKQILADSKADSNLESSKQERSITVRIGEKQYFRGVPSVSNKLVSFEFSRDGNTLFFKDFDTGKVVNNTNVIEPETITTDKLEVLTTKWVLALRDQVNLNVVEMSDYVQRLTAMKTSFAGEIERKKKEIVQTRERKSDAIALGPSYDTKDVITLSQLMSKDTLEAGEMLALRDVIQNVEQYRALISSRGITYSSSLDQGGYLNPLRTYNQRGGVCDEFSTMFAFFFADKPNYDVWTCSFWEKSDGHAIGVMLDKSQKKYCFQSNEFVSSFAYSSLEDAYAAARTHSGYSRNANRNGPRKIKFDDSWVDDSGKSNRFVNPRK